jgi:hypothetical protein
MVRHQMRFATLCLLAVTSLSSFRSAHGSGEVHGDVAADYSAKNGGRAVQQQETRSLRQRVCP